MAKKKKRSKGKKKIDGGKIYPVIDSVQQDSQEIVSNGKPEIVNFVKSMTEKNYAEANKYLQAAIEQKAKQKIRNAVQEI